MPIYSMLPTLFRDVAICQTSALNRQRPYIHPEINEN